ncbi:MAG: hypothetical protein M0C28_09330 [Candidatus Moduliflexus flocculans]|nr:hypothetical protein [Candidatus Moduliflexus flocculans]
MRKRNIRQSRIERLQTADTAGIGGKNIKGWMIFFDCSQQACPAPDHYCRPPEAHLRCEFILFLACWRPSCALVCIHSSIKFNRENPLSRYPGTGNFTGLDEQINLFFMNIQILGNFFCIHQFAGHKSPPSFKICLDKAYSTIYQEYYSKFRLTIT